MARHEGAVGEMGPSIGETEAQRSQSHGLVNSGTRTCTQCRAKLLDKATPHTVAQDTAVSMVLTPVTCSRGLPVCWP